MKLRNKKTGEIIETDHELSVSVPDNNNFYGCKTYNEVKGYNSLAELNEEWEDYEEPKEFYIVENRGTVGSRFRTGDEYEKTFKAIGNYFETEEEAEKAVEKLKAWKRLKDKGFKFHSYYDNVADIGKIYAEFPKDDPYGNVHKDLNLLFSQEDD